MNFFRYGKFHIGVKHPLKSELGQVGPFIRDRNSLYETVPRCMRPYLISYCLGSVPHENPSHDEGEQIPPPSPLIHKPRRLPKALRVPIGPSTEDTLRASPKARSAGAAFMAIIHYLKHLVAIGFAACPSSPAWDANRATFSEDMATGPLAVLGHRPLQDYRYVTTPYHHRPKPLRA